MNERIKAVRKELGLSQEEFGRKLNITGAAISMYEKGKIAVSEQFIALVLLKYPQISEQWLRTGEGEMFRTGSDKDQIMAMLDDLDIPDIAEQFADSYSKLDEEKRMIVNAYVKDVIANLINRYYKEEATDPDPDPDPTIEERMEYVRKSMEEEEASKGDASASTTGAGTMDA